MKPPNVKTSAFVATSDIRTSFTFSRALHHAETGNVLYISKKPITELPKNINLTGPPDKDTLRRITLIYPMNWNEIVSKFSSLHTWKYVPKSIIIDGLDEYFEFLNDSHISTPALLCSALLGAAESSANVTKSICHVIVSFDIEAYKKHTHQFTTLLNTYFYGDIVIDST